MPVSRNALIRYKTIDTCLRNRFRKWTLEDLVDACSDALYEYEGIDKGISKRTVQMDIQLMRSEKLGYNAPIVVKDHKYYTYEDPEYSITNTPLSEQDLKVMSEAVELLKQFNGFSYFSGMGDIISRLEDHVTSVRQKTTPIIDFEKNKLFKIREDSSITALSCFIFINICFFNLLYIIIYIKTQGTSYGYLDIDILLSRLYPCNI